MSGSDTSLESVLERSRSLGFLGPGSVRVHVEHARGFAAGLAEPPGVVLDLGSGGGVPGLALAAVWPRARFVLLDAGERRCAFLRDAVVELGVEQRVRVVRARAEDAGREADLRGWFDLVVSRGFGSPAVTAECGAPFLRQGGLLVVSDPPVDAQGSGPAGRSVHTAVPDGAAEGVAPTAADSGPAPVTEPNVGAPAASDRWPPEGLTRLGLAVVRTWAEPFHYRALRQERPCPATYPRRNGVPAKRPLF